MRSSGLPVTVVDNDPEAVRLGPERVAAILHEWGDGRGGQRLAEEETLQHIRAETGQNLPLLRGFDALRDDVELERLGEEEFDHQVEVALAANRMPGRRGYYSRWVGLEPVAHSHCAFQAGLSGSLPIPVAHAEGKFVARSQAMALSTMSSGTSSMV